MRNGGPPTATAVGPVEVAGGVGPTTPRPATHGRPLAAAGVVVLALVVVVGPRLPAPVGPRATMAVLAFVSLVLESLPFLAAGAILAAWLQRVPAEWVATTSARHPVLAPVLAPLLGMGLPLCDCGLVPLARRLHGESASPAVVNGFVAGAPLTNPIVIVSTLVAFPGRPDMVAGRVAVGLVVAWFVAWLGPRPATRAPDPTDVHDHHDHAGDHCEPRSGVLGAASTELTRTVPTLVVGALVAGALKAVVPADALAALSRQPLLGAAALMVLAFVLAICSQADAFVAASLPVGPLPRLAFLVLGPMLDIRLAALYRREFGTRWVLGYAAAIVPAVLVVATMWVTWGPS